MDGRGGGSAIVVRVLWFTLSGTEILYLVENNSTTVVVGETGCGKTTRMFEEKVYNVTSMCISKDVYEYRQRVFISLSPF